MFPKYLKGLVVSLNDLDWSLKDKVDENSNFNGPVMQRSLLHKVLSLVFAKVDFPGMEHHSSAVGRFFKSGLGRFGLRQVHCLMNNGTFCFVNILLLTYSVTGQIKTWWQQGDTSIHHWRSEWRRGSFRIFWSSFSVLMSNIPRK